MLTPDKVEFVIPSLNRPHLLEKCVASIPSECIVTTIIGTEPRSWGAIINETIPKTTGDVVCYLNDHDELIDGCVEEICRLFNEFFPDMNGAVGLFHDNSLLYKEGVTEYCNIALGRPVLERFPNGQIICPDYYHFWGDTELGLYLSERGEFVYGVNARLKLNHPRAMTAPEDDTHRSSLDKYNIDYAMCEARKLKGWLWGRDFNRINTGTPWWEMVKANA